MSESVFIWVMVALLGLIFGSFATLVSHRLVAGGSIAIARSRCPACATPLGVRDLIPLLSWLLAHGTCRHCHAPIHWRYPVIEAATLVLFLLVFWQTGVTAEFIILALLATCLVIMATVDFEHRIIPDEIQLAMAVLGILHQFAILHTTVAEPLAGLLAGLFLGMALQKGYKWVRGRDGLGTGDVKFLCVAGIWLGVPGLVPLMLLSGLLGIVTALLWRAFGKGEYFPFGPALGMATFLLVLFPEILPFFWHQRSLP